MKNFALFILLCVFGVVFSLESSAQATPQTTSSSTGSLTAGTIDSQFIYLNRISRTQEDFKLVRRRNLDQIRQNVVDSLHLLRHEAMESASQIAGLNQKVGGLQDSLRFTKNELDDALKLGKTTSFLGMQISSFTYHMLLWGIIILLIIILSYSFIRMTRNNMTTREAKNSLENLQVEFDQHRKKSLEKEQKLMRQLQDEINRGNA